LPVAPQHLTTESKFRHVYYPRTFELDSLGRDIISPRSLSAYRRPLSPHTMSPRTWDHARALERATLTMDIRAVLQVIERQGQLDEHVEETKALLPATTPLEAIFGMLDAGKNGYVSDRDLWNFSQRMGHLPFTSIFGLILEIQNGRTNDSSVIRGQLSLKEVGVLVHPRGTLEHEVMDASASDQEARSTLYVMRFTEPCPGCGIRIQRDADSSGCPSVTCPVCHKVFHCVTLMSDRDIGSNMSHDPTNTDHLFYAPLTTTECDALYRIIEASAAAADEIEGLRKQLLLTHSSHLITDAFNAISGGRHYFTFVDLRRALFEYKSWSSERVLQLIWHRYAKNGDHVSLESFARQLQPVMGRV